MKIKPARGMVVVKFSEDPATLDPGVGIPAEVLASGPGCDVDKGDAVLIKSYAKFGLTLSDGSVLLNELAIAATIKPGP